MQMLGGFSYRYASEGMVQGVRSGPRSGRKANCLAFRASNGEGPVRLQADQPGPPSGGSKGPVDVLKGLNARRAGSLRRAKCWRFTHINISSTQVELSPPRP